MELYEQLILAYTSTNNQIRTQAEQTLLAATIENVQNFQFFAQLTQTQDKMQEQAASLLNSVVFKMLTTKSTPFNQVVQLQQIHAQLLCQIIQSPTTPLKCKLLLQKSISLLIRIEKSIKPEIENKMKELLKGDQFWQIQSGTLFFKNLMESLEFQSYNLVINTGLEWITEFFNSSAHIVKNLIQQSTEISDEYLLTLRFYMQVVQEFCEKFFKGKNKEHLIPIQNQLLQLQSFQFILSSIIQYSPQIGTQIQNCIIISTGNELFDNRMNEIKMYCLKSLMVVLNVQLNSRNKIEIKKGIFSSYLVVLVQLLLYSLFSYFAQFKVNVILNKTYLPNIITYSLKLLANLGGQLELYSLFAEAKLALLVDIIYPMLITSQQEYQQMRDLPEEFVSIALDTVDKQEAEIPKTAAAQLIETLCDHVDGSTSLVSQLSVFIIECSIYEISQTQNLSEQQHPIFQQIKQKKLFQDFTQVDRIESSLLILTIISYLLQKRQDIICLMEKMLTNNEKFFLETKEQIIKVRLSLFFGYYCDNLFKQEAQTEYMLHFIQILISYIQPNEPVVLYQAIDALKDVFEDDELASKTRQLVIQVFPQLIGGLNFSSYERHFEMIINLVRKFPSIFMQNDVYIVNLIHILVQRIINEEKLIQQGDKERCIHLNRCWNIIRTLPEQDGLKPLLPKIEQAMTPIYELLTQQEIMNFYEDFVLFISSLIEKQQSISLIQKQILPYFSQIIKKQQGRLGNLFETLNLYMYYGRSIFLEEQTQSIYFTLALQTLVGEESFEDIDLAEGALLVQLGILILNKDINRLILQQVFQQIYQILNKETVYGIIRSRLTCIFLAAFYSIPTLTYELLGEQFKNIFNKVLITEYHPGYDIKLFVITMSSLIRQEHSIFNADVAGMIVKNLNKQEDFEKDEKRKDELDDELMSDEEDDEDDFEEEEERQQAQQQIEQFKSDIIKQDEFTVFRNTVLELKKNNPQLIELLKQTVDGTTLIKLNQLLSFFRIEASEGNDQARKLMKATKRKQIQK